MKLRVSGLKQARLCPGNLAAQEGLPDVASVEASDGTAIHAALCGQDGALEALTPAQRDTYEFCQSRRDKILAKYTAEGDVLVDTVKEEAYTSVNLTGHPDLILFYLRDGMSRAVLVDYKTGWNEVDDPADNLQLRGYAYLLFRTHDLLEEVVVAIVQPTAKETTPCVYTRAEFPNIELELNGIIEGAVEREAKRVPSEEACRYCRAFGTPRCPETENALSTLPITTNWLTLPPEDKARVLDVCSLAEKLIDKIRGAYKTALRDDPAAIAGYKLESAGATRYIPDAQAAFNRLAEVVKPEDFVGACKLSVPKLEKAYGAAVGIKGKALKEAFTEKMAGLLESKEKEPSLTRF